MTSVDTSAIKATLCVAVLIAIIIIFLLLFTLTSCMPEENTDGKSEDPEAGSAPTFKNQNKADLYLFDYEKIKLEITGSIGVRVKNTNIYTDIYEDLIILGEIENISEVNKTDIGITFDFYDKDDEEIISETVAAPVNYLKSGSRLPFYYYLDEKEKFINISKIKIGINYKDYNKRFKGNPIVKEQRYYYTGEGRYLIIEGRVINIGTKKIRNLKLFCTFYNELDRVVFIKSCYLLRQEMIPEEEQKFSLKILLDEYLPEFTHYRFEVFFEDEIKPGA